MGAADPAPASGDLAALSDEQLVERIRDSHDQRAARVLWDRYYAMMREALRTAVFGGLCPDGENPGTFSQQCESRAFITFGRRMAVFRFEMSMHNWLHLIARAVALNELDSVKRQQREQSPRSPEGDEGEDGKQPGEPTDEDQMVLFRSKYVRVRSQHAENPLELAAKEERRKFLLELIAGIILDKDPDCATALRLRFWRDWSYSQIGGRL